jgi:hypothetical protein
MTTTADKTLAGVVNDANPNNIADALAKVKLGTLLTPQTRAIVQASSVDVILDPPALGPASVTARVTAGTALAGVYRVTDTDGTEVDSATLGVATLSADGGTLTFAAAVTELVVDYIPRSAVDMTSDFNVTGLG